MDSQSTTKCTNYRMLNLQALPKKVCARWGSAVNMDDNRIIYAAPNYPQALYTYDAGHDQWSKLFQCKKRFDREGRRVGQSHQLVNFLAYDAPSNSLYLIVHEDHLTKIDLTRRKEKKYWYQIQEDIQKRYFEFWNMNMLCIDGDLHFLSKSNDGHAIMEMETRQIEEQPVWYQKKCRTIVWNYRGEQVQRNQNPRWHFPTQLQGGKAVYVPSKNIILLFGGTITFDSEIGEVTRDVFKGELNSDGKWYWEEVAEGLGNACVNTAVTANGRYVIVSPVTSSEYWVEDKGEHYEFVQYIDTENEFKWKCTNIKIPLDSKRRRRDMYNGAQIMFRTGNSEKTDLTVNGYVRKQYRQRDFKGMQLIPVVLMKLIQSLYSQELIHWIDDERHVAIPLKDIVSAPSESVEPADPERDYPGIYMPHGVDRNECYEWFEHTEESESTSSSSSSSWSSSPSHSDNVNELLH